MTFGQESEGSESEFGDIKPKSIPCREISCKVSRRGEYGLVREYQEDWCDWSKNEPLQGRSEKCGMSGLLFPAEQFVNVWDIFSCRND